MAMFDSSRAKIRHAQRTFELVRAAEFAFRDSDPFKDVCAFEFRDGTIVDVYKTVLRVELPETVSAYAYDTIYSLRSALDNACYDIAEASGSATSKAIFPFGDDAAAVKNARNWTSKHIPAPAFDFIASLQPHRQGNMHLWALNRLCNTDKHKFVTPTGLAVGGARIRRVTLEAAHEYSFPPRWDMQRGEMVHAIVPHGARFTQDVQLQLMLTIPALPETTHAPVLDVLATLIEIVTNIVDELEERAPAWTATAG